MSLIFYGVLLFLFVCKVCLFLVEKGFDYQLEVIVFFGQLVWYCEISLLGCILVLCDGDLVFVDFSVICQYLEECYFELLNFQGDVFVSCVVVCWLEKYVDYEIVFLVMLMIFCNWIFKLVMGQVCEENDVCCVLEEKLLVYFDYLENYFDGWVFFVGE